MTPSIASQQLSNELWTSFASLLRSHVAMHSIARPGGGLRVISNAASTVEVIGPYGKLTVLAPGTSRMGATEFRPEAGELGDEYAAFFFTEDGLFQSEGLADAMDIEAAVEFLLRKVKA
jgi:hypothetical protein